MKIREHVWVADKCIWCGAPAWAAVRAQAVLLGKGDPGPDDERTCRERDDYQHDLSPEPARREVACEAFDEIKKRVDELDAERTEAMNAEE